MPSDGGDSEKLAVVRVDPLGTVTSVAVTSFGSVTGVEPEIRSSLYRRQS